MCRTKYLILLSLLFLWNSLCNAQSYKYVDVRGEDVIVTDTIINFATHQYFWSRIDYEPITGVVYRYADSILLEEICVVDGLWNGFRQFYYRKSNQDSIHIIKYRLPAADITFSWMRKSEKQQRQLSIIEIENHNLMVKYMFHNRFGSLFLKTTDYYKGSKISTTRLRFSDVTEFKCYIIERQIGFKSYMEFLTGIGFFNDNYKAIPVGCFDK